MTTDEKYIHEALDLARESAANGNNPFGSLLVYDGEVIERSWNTTVTDDDITAHPELKLARDAARKLSPAEREACTMYTSTEPCEMCATAIHYAGLGRVVFSVSTEAFADFRERPSGYTCAGIIEAKGGETAVDGPILEDEGLEIHREFYGD